MLKKISFLSIVADHSSKHRWSSKQNKGILYQIVISENMVPTHTSQHVPEKSEVKAMHPSTDRWEPGVTLLYGLIGGNMQNWELQL